MKNSYGHCRVLSQQTILNFNQYPPSILGAKHMPLSVTEERAGERRFAMATETQLRFNLDVPPIPTNLASNFQPQPSPVVIDKPPVARPCVQTSNASTNNAFSERLALAIKLAKRDLRNGLIGVPSHSTTGEEQYTGGAFQTPVAQPLPPVRGVDTPRAEPSGGGYRPGQPTAPAEEAPHMAEHVRHYPAQLKQVTDEIIRLRKELTAEVQKLKQLKMGNQGAGVKKREVRSARPLDDADLERQGWEAKEDEEGRLKRKVTEQTARNTRMLYDLQQQVNELQKDADEKPPHVRHTKKSLAMHRLAAAHKAVLGTLQNHFSACVSAGCGRPLPAELALLVERLVLLGTQLHIDAGEGGLLEDLKALGGRWVTPMWKSLLDQSGISQRIMSDTPPMLVGRKEAQDKLCQASSCAPAKATQHDHTPDRGKGIKCVSVSCATQTTHHEAQQDTDGLRSWAEQDLNSMLEGSKRPSVKAECFTPQESTHPHAKDVRSLEELCMLGPVTRVQPTGKVGSPPNTCTFDGTLRKTVCDTTGRTTHECTEMEPPSCVKYHLLDRADLQSMLARLEECEAEEQAIRQRWTSLAYEDPFHQTENEVSISHQPVSQPLSLPVTALASIQQYQAAHEHYLELTGIRTAEGFDPWKLVESIADELLEEQVGHVTAEIADMCDKCVDGLYSAEFVIPKTSHT
ncbi:hypothetical protein EMCRGX_G024983 [Ephydatia muelleri]